RRRLGLRRRLRLRPGSGLRTAAGRATRLRRAALVGEDHRPHLLAGRALVRPDADDVPALVEDVRAVARRLHERVVDDAGRDVVGVVVPADVLAGDRAAVVLLVEDVEDVIAGRRDVVAEVVAGDHVLAPPAGDRRERRIDPQRA